MPRSRGTRYTAPGSDPARAAHLKSALAGLLIVIGIELLKPAHIETALRNRDFAVYAVTTFSVVFLNLLQGVMIGLALAVALTGWRVIRATVEAGPVGEDCA